jgi:hypothetical protein
MRSLFSWLSDPPFKNLLTAADETPAICATSLIVISFPLTPNIETYLKSFSR